ncbi:PIN2/TERF1-interacting telomerase inhibitor 1 [Suncus etruscus]|uniref:PIN2/TERF1-interacting telomerase inhibitor 1 n=1 Tax=Suncus etruscus TaxID=109475 RepID=UPI0021100B68|nr:PIN2/TERF1-interacting telomerase inhibitor 1 [Suncus etruscus]
MSMLAERRRKQKWAVDPQNTAWSNDESKFGQRMLEKMGWSKGKGLGAQEQGATEHIKVRVKNNQLGLGAAISNEDNWLAHQDDFDQLLAALNTRHGQEATDASGPKEKKSFGLEQKSKVSRSRVHYMKFTKGKDLSSRSRMDLDCIFGKRRSKRPPEEDPDAVPPDASETSTTTTSAISIQEYFAQRMAERKGKALRPGAGPESPDTPMAGKVAKKRKKAAQDQSVDAPAQDGPEKQKDSDQDGQSIVPLEARDGDTYSPMWPREKPGKKKRLRQVEDGLASDGDLVKKKKKTMKKKKKCSE